MEKKINKLEAIIKEYMTEVGPRKDLRQSAEAEPDKVDKEVHKEVRQAHEASTDDGLKPMHSKDTKPLPEFDGSRKDFMPWHESFTSVLRLRSAKWGKIVDWLKAKRDNRVLDGQAEADFLAYSKNHGPDEYIKKNEPSDNIEEKRQRKRRRKLENDFNDSNLSTKAEVNPYTPAAVDPVSVLLDPKAIVYQGFGFLFHETDASKKSFLESPGLMFASRMVPDLNIVDCAPVAVILNEEELKCKQACIAYVKACQPFYKQVPDERIERALESWERFFGETYPHSVDDLLPVDYFMDWNILIRDLKDTATVKASVVACEARELIDAYTGGSNFRNQEPIQYAEKKERDTLVREYKEVAAISHNRREIDLNMFIDLSPSKE